MTLSDEKSRLRHQLKTVRAQLSEVERAQAALALRDRLWPFIQKQGPQSIGLYLARSVEISLDPLIRRLLDVNIEVSAPRLDPANAFMEFRRLHSLEHLQLGAFNVREPLGDEVAHPTLVLVPAVAFDTVGRRLGMGGGWYDRTLTPEMTTVGVCFDCQIVPHVPTEEHDRSMNWVFSESRALGPF